MSTYNDRTFDAIMSSKCTDSFKAMINKQRNLLTNIQTLQLKNIILPNQVWIGGRGIGITVHAGLYAEFLKSMQAFSFRGEVDILEFNLRYIAQDIYFFSERTRFDNAMANAAGRTRCFLGILQIDVSEWEGHFDEPHFTEFLGYLTANSDKWNVIFSFYSDLQRSISELETVLAYHMNIEVLYMEKPCIQKSIEYITSRMKQKYGILIDESANNILREVIEKISGSKHFKEYHTLRLLSDDIPQKILEYEDIQKKSPVITSDILIQFVNELPYVRQSETHIGDGVKIGFSSERSK
jgi:hypothetical protein